jgi:hypothetical protein
MRWPLLCLLAAALFVPSAAAQDAAVSDSEETAPQPRNVPATVVEMQAPMRVSATTTLPNKTEVWLRLADPVKVKEIKVGDQVNFVLYRDLYYRNWLLAKAGTAVEASVQQVDMAKRMKRGSKIVIVFHGLNLLNGQVVPLTGDTKVKGGAGTGGHIAGGLLEISSKCNALPCVLFDIPALPTALVLGLTTKGENRNAKVDTSAPAFVDGDVVLDLAAMEEKQPPADAPGKVMIVRGVFGGLYSRDLYCNGVPLTHLDSKHKLELELKPGYYRFSINPKKGAMEMFVSGGSEIKLMADYRDVYELNEQDNNINTDKVTKKRSAGELFRKAKPVEKGDLYGTECQPLAEEAVP